MNFNFLKAQIKNSIWITIGFACFFIMVSIFSISFVYFFWDTTVTIGGSIRGYDGAINILGLVNLFGPVGEIIAITFVVALAIKLINVEINRSYLSSWLTLPISRTKIFNTKIATIFLSSLIIVFLNLMTESLTCLIKGFTDFSGYEFFILVKLNLGLLLVFWFVGTVAIFWSFLFNRTSFAVTFSVIIPLIFVILFLVGNFGPILGVESLKYLKFLTVFSLYEYQQLLDEQNIQFIWKFLLLLLFTVVILFGSWFLFKNKNLHI